MQIDTIRTVAGDDIEIFAISASAHSGLKEVLRALRVKVNAIRAYEIVSDDYEDELPVIGLSEKQISEAWTVEKDDETNVYIVRGEKIEKFARRTNLDNYEAINRLRDIMKKLGITHQLTRAGATGESIIQIGDSEFPLLEQ